MEKTNNKDCNLSHMNTNQTYPIIPEEYFYDYFYESPIIKPETIIPEMINISNAFSIYNWFVEQYYDVINIYDNFYEKYNEIEKSAKIGSMNLFRNRETIKKLGEYKIFHKIHYPHENIIPHNEMIDLLNKMNSVIINIKNFIHEIYEIIKKNLIIDDVEKLIKNIMKDIAIKSKEWKMSIKSNISNIRGGQKIPETMNKIDEISEKIKILNDLFKDPYKINDILENLKENKIHKMIQKTVEMLKQNYKYNQILDNKKKDAKIKKKYNYHNYEIKEFPQYEVPDLKIDYKYFENEKNNIDISKFIKILDEKINLINSANKYLDTQHIFLNEKYNNIIKKKKEYKNNDFTFLEKEDMIGDKQIFLKYINNLEELKKHPENIELYNNIDSLYKKAGYIIKKYNNYIIVKSDSLKDEIESIKKLIEQDEEKYNIGVNNQIKLVIDFLFNFFSEKKYKKYQIYFDKNKYNFSYDNGNIIGENKNTNTNYKLREKLVEIKKEIKKEQNTELQDFSEITKNYAKLYDLKTTLDANIQPKNKQIKEKTQEIADLNKKIVNYESELKDTQKQDILLKNAYERAKKINFKEYMDFYENEYKIINDKYNISKTFIDNKKSELKLLKEEILNKEEFKFSFLLKQNKEIKKKLVEKKSQIFIESKNLNEKLFNIISEMKKISESTELVIDFIAKDELEKINNKDKIFVNLVNTDFYKMTGGYDELYQKNMILVKNIYVFLKNIDDYLNKYFTVLKINREIIYKIFYEYIVINELLNSKFDPIMYLTYDEIEEYEVKLSNCKNLYMISIIEEMKLLCQKIKNIKKVNSILHLYIDNEKEDLFMDLLLLLHLVKMLK
jgi:hypothetical protein